MSSGPCSPASARPGRSNPPALPVTATQRRTLRSVSSGDQCGWLGVAAWKQYNFVHNLYKWIFYNVAMTEVVTLLDPTIALALPN